jgi:hypothetical protein
VLKTNTKIVGRDEERKTEKQGERKEVTRAKIGRKIEGKDEERKREKQGELKEATGAKIGRKTGRDEEG